MKQKKLNANKKDKLSVKQICKLFKCGKCQVYNVLKGKEKKRKEQWMNGIRLR